MKISNKIPPSIGVLEGKGVYFVCTKCVVNYGGIISYEQ